jgi:GMP synthase-like glutamine amidotransferase
MIVGIVNMYKSSHGALYIAQAILALGHTPLLLQYTEPNLYEKIRDSAIRHWIFSGSNQTVTHKLSPRIRVPKLLQMWEKTFFLICYSMESALLELGHPVKRRPSGVKREIIPLLLKGKLIRVWRNHRYFVPSLPDHSQVHEYASYAGESMYAEYKNLTMTQFHPERTPDGYILLKSWIGLV